MLSLYSWVPKSHICGSCRRSLQRSIHSNAFHQPLLRPVVRRSATSSRSFGARSERRKVSASEVFTALYTTIMATAAVADAKYKDRRRKNLDERLAQARDDLSRVLQESSAAEEIMSTASASSDGLFTALTSICGSTQKHILQDQRRTRQRESYANSLHKRFAVRRSGQSPWPTANSELDDILEALWKEDKALYELGYSSSREERASKTIKDQDGYDAQSLRQSQREPLTPVHLAKLTTVTNNLADKLIAESYRLQHPVDEKARRLDMGRLDSSVSGVRMLRFDGYPQYETPALDLLATDQVRFALNAAAWKIFDEWEREQVAGVPARKYQQHVKYWVAKLCHNLLVSRVPPGIHNYNALILGFTRVGEHSLAQKVVQALLYHSRYRPTQQTLVCLLQHYRSQGDLLGFYRVIRRLAGLDPRGILIRRRTLQEAVQPQFDRTGWFKRRDLSIAGEYVVQRARMDEPVCTAIVTGLLSMRQVWQAATVFAGYWSSCGRMGADLLLRVVQCVVEAVDNDAAKVLISSMLVNAAHFSSLLLSDDADSQQLAIQTRRLLAIASAPDVPRSIQTRIPADNVPHLLHGAEKNSEHIARALFVSDTHRYLRELRPIVLDALVAASDPEADLSQFAEEWLARFSLLKRQERQLVRTQHRYRFMAETQAVEQAATSALSASDSLMESFLHNVRQSTEMSAPYEHFLRKSWIPVGIRLASYTQASSAAAMAVTAEEEQRIWLERLTVVDMEAVVSLLEDELKAVLLRCLPPEERAAAKASMLSWPDGATRYAAVIHARRDQSRPRRDERFSLAELALQYLHRRLGLVRRSVMASTN